MKLIVNDLTTASLYQTITPTADTIVEAIRPHLYIHNLPSGSLKIQVLDINNELVAESALISISSMTTLPYFHGYVRFYVSVHMQSGVDYRIKLASSGYTYSESAYVSWCNDFDLIKYTANYNPTGNWERPLDLEIWSRTP